jgi:hypothetical protein
MLKNISVAIFVGLIGFDALAAAEDFPVDVLNFLEERESCDHWRSELGYDEERQADIDWSICQSCPGSDSKLAGLKIKYRFNKVVMSKLDELESNIEPTNNVEAKKFCQNTRKPSWG